MKTFRNADSVQVVHDMISIIQKNKEYLSEIDGAIGDGDHGINMNKGFSLCMNRLNQEDTLASALGKLGNVLLGEIGGSMGPLYGMFFLAMSKASENKEEIDMQTFGEMLHAASKEIADLGNAQVGDKTLMDTLIPALHAYEEAREGGKGFEEALEIMDTAAKDGQLSTKDLVAKIGRASRLGERSRGVLDAGATSCYLLLHSMKESIITLLEGRGA